MGNNNSKDWFSSWFDSKYYHILYKNRDKQEAQFFIDNLIKYLSPNENAKILDLACGKGRHSIYLNSLGFGVTGIDLSTNSIAFAKQFENSKLNFEVHDMREMYQTEVFDYVLNLFTSFGYFDDNLENLNTLISAKNSLKRGGTIVIDFFNANRIESCQNNTFIKEVDGIVFNIEKKIEGQKVVKSIKFKDDKDYYFEEKVQLLTLDDFSELLNKSRFQLIDLFGDYHLNEFDENNSERLIIVAKKL